MTCPRPGRTSVALLAGEPGRTVLLIYTVRDFLAGVRRNVRVTKKRVFSGMDYKGRRRRERQEKMHLLWWVSAKRFVGAAATSGRRGRIYLEIIETICWIFSAEDLELIIIPQNPE